MFQSIKNAVSLFIDLGVTRLELVAIELEEERLRLADLLLSACVAFFFWFLAIVLSILFVIVLMWDDYRLATIGFLAFLFLLLAALMSWRWRQKAQNKPRFLAATLGEFNLDVQALRALTKRSGHD